MPGEDDGYHQAVLGGDPADVADLAMHAHRIEHTAQPVDLRPPVQLLDTGRNREIADGPRDGLRLPSRQLRVDQKEHADRKDENRRRDEQAEVEMQVAGEPVQCHPTTSSYLWRQAMARAA